MRTWIYHRTKAAKIVDTAEVDMAELHMEGWRHTPAAFDSPEPDAAELGLPVPEPIKKARKPRTTKK
jgi:hypothetical protein